MNPLLLPPRLLLRALDDLHTLALAAQDIGGRLDGLEERADRIEMQIADAVGVAHRIERLGQAVLALGERIDARGEAMLAMGDRMEGVAREIMAEGREIQAVAHEVAVRGADVAAALPLLQRAVEMGEPLEGAVERLGRMVDRLPGGRGGRRTSRTGDDDEVTP